MAGLIKWNYVALRPSTEYELEYRWDGLTPEEDETVFVSDGVTTWVDTWIYHSRYSCGFEDNTDLEEFYWASIPMPQPPIEEVT